MKWKMIDTPLGLSQPYGVSYKFDAFDAGIQQIGIWGNTLNTILANNANRKATESTNQANREINEQQIAYAREQYERERMENRYLIDQAYQRELENREYNSPARLKARYIAAGINPYLVMHGGSSVGSSSVGATVGSPPKGSQPNAIPMDKGFPVQTPDWSALANFHADISDMMYKKQMAYNDTLRALADVKEKGASSRSLDASADRLIQEIGLNRESWDDLLSELHHNAQLRKFEALSKEQEYEALKFANSVAPELNDLQKRSLSSSIAVAAAQVANINANTSLTEQQKLTEIERTTQEAITRANLPKTLHNNNAIQVATHDQIKKQAALLKEQAASERWRTIDLYKGSKDTRPSRTAREYLDYVTDALQYTDLNNSRGFFRAR